MPVSRVELFRHAKFLFPNFMITFVSGCTYGWVPQAIFKLQDGHSSMQATPEECSWIASFTNIGQIAAAIPAGMLMNKFGKRNILLAIGILYFLGWAAQCAITSVTGILVLRLIYGFCSGASATIAPLYIAEISSAKIRGAALTTNSLIFSFGTLFELAIGKYFNLDDVARATCFICSLFILCAHLLVESPNDLISKDQDKSARKVLEWLRCGQNDEDISKEFENIKEYVENRKMTKLESFATLMKTKQNVKSLAILTCLNCGYIFTGRSAMFSYSAFLMPDNNILKSDNLPIIMIMISVSSCFLPPILIDRFSRKYYLAIPCLISIIPNICIGITYHFKLSNPNVLPFDLTWILLFCICVETVIGAAFLNAAITTLRGELLPHAIKGVGSGISIVCTSLAGVVMIHVYRFVMTSFGLQWNFYMSAVASINLAIFAFIFIPNTNRKLLGEIQAEKSVENHTESTKC